MKIVIFFTCILHTAILYLLQVKMKRPVLQGTQVEIIRSGQFYTVLLGKDISLSWDKGTHLLVHISSTYRVLISKHYFELVKSFFSPIHSILYEIFLFVCSYMLCCLEPGVWSVW